MNQIYKSVLSIMTIVTFLLMAYASVPSNSGFPEEKCEFKHQASFDGMIDLLVIDKATKATIPGASVNISFSCYYGKLEDIPGSIEYECKKVNECFTYPFENGVTDDAGKLTLNIGGRTYATDLDGTGISISISKEGYEGKYLSLYRNHENASSVVATIELLNKELL